MKRITSFLIVIVLFGVSALHAQQPAGATGQCKDGTYSTAKSKSGACRGHNGVQTWYAAAPPAGATTPAPATASPASAAPATASPATTPATANAKVASPARGTPATPATQAAAGGGPGMVWVNTSTKVYHCNGDRYYGKTKNGSYMSESDAVAKGARPDAGKPCAK